MGSLKIVKKIKENVGLIIVDEGHYEPAHKWSSCIRQFEDAAKIIFTATPYRNDFREFDISEDYIYFCSYHRALRKEYVRSVQLLESKLNVNESDFAEAVASNYLKLKKESKILESAKVIIRCDDSESIRKVAQYFSNENLPFVAIHERFRNEDDDCFTNNVPDDIENHPATIWIHQFKLMEGIDAPSFQFITCFDKHNNTRSLIQEIGRGLRCTKNKGSANKVTYYLDNEGGKSFFKWKQFLKFDKYLDDNGETPILNIEEREDKYIKSYPRYMYMFGEIRETLEFNEVNSENDVLLPLICNIYSSNDLNFKTLSNLIISTLVEEDRSPHIIYDNTIDQLCIIHTGMSPNRYLPNHLYPQHDLEVIYIVKLEKFLYIYDKSRISDKILLEKAIISNIDAKVLNKLLIAHPNTFVNHISLYNLNLNTHTIRNKGLNALNLMDVSPSLDDYFHACSNIKGYSFEGNPLNNSVEEYVSRYIGFTTGRVTQDLSCKYSLEEYRLWLNIIENICLSQRRKLGYLNRYSQAVVPVKDLKLANILLFLEGFEESFVYKDKKGANPYNNVCSDIESESFEIVMYDKKYAFLITKERDDFYRLKCDEFDDDFVCKEQKKHMSATSFFNMNQSFSLLFDDPSFIYTLGSYYRPEIKVGEEYDSNQFDVLSLLESNLNLTNVESEKGNKVEINRGKETWEKNSIFRLIVDLKVDGGDIKREEINYLICDDMNTEMADFILCTGKKVIFIHAKYGGGSKCSASNLQEICGQSTKNVFYLSPYCHIEPKGIKKKWSGPWKSRKLSIKSRLVINKNNMIPDLIWSDIKKQICNPKIEKEVWLVLGNLLSKKEFKSNLTVASNYRAEALQASLLLLACSQNVNAVGAKLRVFTGQ